MITVTLLNDSTIALSGGYEQKDAIKQLEGATWDRSEKRWLVPVRCAALVRRLSCAETPEATVAMNEAIGRALAFNAAGFRSMERVSPLIREYCSSRGISCRL